MQLRLRFSSSYFLAPFLSLVACGTSDKGPEDQPNEFVGDGDGDMGNSDPGDGDMGIGDPGDGDSDSGDGDSGDGDAGDGDGAGGSLGMGGSGAGGSGGGAFSVGDVSGPPDRDVEYVKVVGAARQACALRADGQLECWGSGGATRPPAGEYIDVAISSTGGPRDGREFGCAVRADDGRVDCWGRGLNPALVAPDLAFRSISASGDHSVCGIRADNGRAECWGLFEKDEAPDVEFAAIENVGDVCGIRAADDLTVCFNRYSNVIVDYTDIPLGRMQSESLTVVGGAAYCAAPMGEEALECFAFATESEGTALTPETLNPDGDGFTAIAGNYSHACGVNAATRLPECWGDVSWTWSSAGQDYVAAHSAFVEPPATEFTQLTGTLTGICGLTEGSGAIECWGGQRALPDNGRSFAVLASGNVTCGLRTNTGRVSCLTDYLGDGESRFLDPPMTSFVDLALGTGFACGLEPSGHVECWGDSYTAETPETVFQRIAANSSTVCGIDAVSGELSCWNADGSSAAAPPAGAFQTLSASSIAAQPLDGHVDIWAGDALVEENATATGNSRFCGVQADGTLNCWGCAQAEDCEVPVGDFRVVSAGLDQACALTTEGAAVCFPADVEQPDAEARFTEIAVGFDYACGLEEDGTAQCWGAGTSRQPPSQPMTHLSVGHGYGCGISKDDGSAICWGTFERNLWD